MSKIKKIKTERKSAGDFLFSLFIYLFISRMFYKDSYFNKNGVINAGPWRKKYRYKI